MKALIEFTERFGNILSRVLLTVLYYVVLGPFAIVYKLVADPLHLRDASRRATGLAGTTQTTPFQRCA